MKQFFSIFLILIISGKICSQQLNLNTGELSERKTKTGSSILDDSTRMEYGPNTTRYLFEREITFRLDTPRAEDTSLIDFHESMDPIMELDYKYHDLGNIGTAMNPLFFKIPKQPGAKIGIDAFDYYFVDNDEIKYYNTESPFSWFDVIWGGNGRSVTRAGYTRNINSRWNFGGDFQGYFIDKQIQRSRRGDRNAESIGYDLYTWYNSGDLRYTLMANFARTKHKIFETGGVDVDINESEEDFYLETAPLKLNTVEGLAYKNNFHLLQSYTIRPMINLVNIIDWGKRIHGIKISPGSEDNTYFDTDPVIDYDGEEIDETRFFEFSNNIGIQGHSKNLYYRALYQLRRYSIDYKHLFVNSKGADYQGYEHSLNGELGLLLNNVFDLESEGKYILSGQHYLKGKIFNKFLEAELIDSKWKPGLVKNYYLGHYDYWNKSFEDPWATIIRGKLKLTREMFSIKPGVEFQSIRNYIYFNQSPRDTIPSQTVLPVQSGNPVGALIAKLETGLKFNKITVNAEANYSLINENARDIYPTPQWLINGKIAYEDQFFNKALHIHTGLQVHWKSDYYAMGYDPLVQQFFTQQDFLVPDYLLATLFLNAKIKSGLIFVKLNNLRQMFYPTGYITTPHYPGVRSLFDFGFQFNFYD